MVFHFALVELVISIFYGTVWGSDQQTIERHDRLPILIRLNALCATVYD